MVKLASHPYNTRSKEKQKMPPKDGNESDNDEEIQNKMTSQEIGRTKEIRALKQQMAEMYEAWMSGQPPPSSIRDYFNTNISHPI